ncbi:MAG: amidohydrolase family protein [Lentisphaeria bacterium]|nr:amidohydrolase family protein [Lentisphaeria bacterium]
MSSELLITGGKVYDGIGNMPIHADILLRDDRILSVVKSGSVVFSTARKLDASGLIVSPGWIDIHAHSDLSLLADPQAYSKVSQGVTTEVSGNCGLSAFPVLTGEVREHLEILYQKYDVPITWHDFRTYADQVDSVHPAINPVFLCGHNTLRANISGYAGKTLSADSLSAMKQLLRKMLEQGAAGVSSGLLYVPGCFSNERELLELLTLTASMRRIYATHLRNEGDRLEEALAEALFLAEKSGVPLLISHLKTALPRNWYKLDHVLDMIEKFRKSGTKIFADRYPYTYSQTSLSIVLSSPFDRMDDRLIRDHLQHDPECAEKALTDLIAQKRDWNRVILTNTAYEPFRKFCGRSVFDIAAEYARSPEKIVIQLLREDAPGTMAAFGGMSDENLNRILQQDWICCGSDETARPENSSLGISHPRGFGSFPRFIRLAQKQGIALQEILRRLTSLPASILQLPERGVLKPGYFADLVLFDPEKLQDQADFPNPHTAAEGIHTVIVNGRVSYTGESRQVTSQRAGRVLRCTGK